MPSMRALTAGVALDRCHVVVITVLIYQLIVHVHLMNVCIYLCVAQVLDFLLNERMYHKLPEVNENFEDRTTIIKDRQ